MKIKKGMRVLIKRNMFTPEEWLTDYVGLEGVVKKVGNLNNSYAISVCFKENWLREQSLGFDIEELKIISKNNIRKI